MNWQIYITSQLHLTLWTEGTKYYSQASHLVRPYQNSCLYTNTRIGHLRNNSRTFTKRLNLLLFLYLVSIVVSCVCMCKVFILPSSYSFPIQFLSICSPPHPFSTNMSQHYHFLPLACLLTNLLHQLYTTYTQPQPPEISDTSTLRCNRNTHKHAQGPENPTAFIPLPPPSHHFSYPSF
jgi:hypothetical protein